MRRVWVLSLYCGLACADAGGQIFAGQEQKASDGRTAAENQARAEASEAMEARDYGRAVKVLEPLAKAHPEDAHLLFDLALAEDASDQNAAAEASYRQAEQADAGFVEARIGLGLLLARTGRVVEAHQELAAAVAIPNGDKFLFGRAYRAMARLDATTAPELASEELLAALKLTPETPEDVALSGELAGRVGDSSEAEQAYRKALAKHPNDPAAAAGLAHLLVAAKKPAEAEPVLAIALAEHPDDAGLTAQLADVYATEGKPAEALPLVKKLYAAEPGNAGVSRMLADVYGEIGEYAKAEPLLATLEAQSPRDGPLLDDHAEALIHLHRYAEAEALLKRAVVDPASFKSPEELGLAATHLALAASENHDAEAALQALSLRGSVLPPSPSSLFLEAISHDTLRHRKEAVAAYRRFLAVTNGKFPDQEFQARHRLVALEH